MLEIRVGEGIVARTPEIITSGGLGSCIVVTLYDTRMQIGGLAHIMLPYSKMWNNSRLEIRVSELQAPKPELISPYQFADTSVTALLKEMQREGARIEDIVAKMVGGAKMFYFNGENSPGIGEQNIAYMQKNLRKEGVPLIGKDIGGHHGRSIEFYLDSGRVIVKAVGIKDKEI